MKLQHFFLAVCALLSLSAWAGADFRAEQDCMADLAEISLPPSKNLTESIPVNLHQVVKTDRDDDLEHDELKPSVDDVIFAPTTSPNEIFLITHDMRYKCQIPAKVGASAKIVRFVLQDKIGYREYIELGVSKDRGGKLEISSQLKTGEVVDLVLGLLTTLGFGQVAAEVSEKVNESMLIGAREFKCRESLDVNEVRTELRNAIVDKVERLEAHYDQKNRDMDKSLEDLCKVSDCDENPSLSERKVIADDRVAEDLREHIFKAVKSCGPLLKDDEKISRYMNKLSVRFDPSVKPESLSAHGTSATSY